MLNNLPNDYCILMCIDSKTQLRTPTHTLRLYIQQLELIRVLSNIQGSMLSNLFAHFSRICLNYGIDTKSFDLHPSGKSCD